MVLPSGPGGKPSSDATPPVFDALLPTAEEVRWVSLELSGVPAAELGHHPLVASGQVRVLPEASVAVSPETAGVVEHAWPDDVSWLWFLPADAQPRADALAAMTAVLRDSGRVAAVGPKLVRTAAPRVVVGVGHRVTRWGRSAEGDDVGAYDQGQFDDRSDVIAVPCEGMVVRADVVQKIGGVDPRAHPSVVGLDLCWRAHLHGYRVQVVPDAVVSVDGSAGDGDVAVGRSARVPVRQRAQARAEVALARAAWWRLPPRALAMLACSLWVTALMLLLRRPRAAGVAWAEAAAVISARRVWAARWRFRGRGRLSEKDLASVFEPGRAARSAARLMPLDAPVTGQVFSPGPVPERVAPAVRGTSAESSGSSLDSGPVCEEFASPEADAKPARWWNPALVAALALACAVTAARWWELTGALDGEGWGVRGSEVLGVGASAPDLWSAWWFGWTGAGLGQAGQGPSWLLPMSGLTWLAEQVPGGPVEGHGASVVTAWLLCSSLVLSVVVAYVSAKAVVRSRAVRAALALGWAGLAPMTGAVDAGRLGPALVHVIAPALVAGVVLSLRPGRQGTSASFGTALLVAAAAWWVPVVTAVGVVGGAVLLISLRGAARLRGLALALLPLVLLGPHLLQYHSDPVMLFGGAGSTVAGAEALAGWQGLLMHPTGAVRISMWWVMPIWLLAVVAVLAPGGRRAGRLATGLTLAGVCGLAGGVLASRLVVGELPAGYEEAGLGVTMWPGTFASLGGAAVFMAGGIGAGRLVETSARRGRGTTLGTVLLAVAAVAAVAMSAVHAVTPSSGNLNAADAPVPAVVAERLSGPGQVRLLQLTPVAAGPTDNEVYGVRYQLQGAEPSPWLRDRARDLAQAPPLDGQTQPGDAAALADPVARAVDTVLTPAALSADHARLTREQLADLAVGYVSVLAPQDHALVGRIDEDPSLTRVSSAPGTALWRVASQTPGARVRWEASSGERSDAAPSTGPHGRARLARDGGPEMLVVSEPAAWAHVAQVRADGEILTPEPGFPVRYTVPEQAERVVVDVPPPHLRWWLLTGGVALVAAVAAVPLVGRERGRGA
ncbi:MAG TPA: hypothetical protein VJ976_09530 [Ornithinimicrobium sp.]|uniref:hypothetical protein n=1 Tax=Ornithinimicrobium sp. TaxID=1977084 RepID=UPI002B48E7D7|nr:hypothetical protein [Ornithinimicrobium sp.]HKJ12609.1 hypothetical protein [Ornithinimicrobium sp.]